MKLVKFYRTPRVIQFGRSQICYLSSYCAKLSNVHVQTHYYIAFLITLLSVIVVSILEILFFKNMYLNFIIIIINFLEFKFTYPYIF